MQAAAHREGYRVTILHMRNGWVGPELTLDLHVQLGLGDDGDCSCLNKALLGSMPLGWGVPFPPPPPSLQNAHQDDALLWRVAAEETSRVETYTSSRRTELPKKNTS